MLLRASDRTHGEPVPGVAGRHLRSPHRGASAAASDTHGSTGTPSSNTPASPLPCWALSHFPVPGALRPTSLGTRFLRVRPLGATSRRLIHHGSRSHRLCRPPFPPLVPLGKVGSCSRPLRVLRGHPVLRAWGSLLTADGCSSRLRRRGGPGPAAGAAASPRGAVARGRPASGTAGHAESDASSVGCREQSCWAMFPCR